MTTASASDPSPATHLEKLDVSRPIWDQFFTVAPLVLVGTREADGGNDLAPKHMVTPMGWQNYFGFVCTPRHGTYQNIKRDGVFAVTYPRPAQWLETSLTASPRCEDDSKPQLQLMHTHRSGRVDCPVVEDGYLYLECEIDRFVDDFGVNSLIVGKIVAAEIDRAFLRAVERDDQDLLRDAPLLAYVSPGRFATIQDTLAFPMPKGMKK
ncbi:MAG: flavin reductase [Rhodobacteraceae bacterium]|nr:flavin reductase [Paracoccaceae bacterium]